MNIIYFLVCSNSLVAFNNVFILQLNQEPEKKSVIKVFILYSFCLFLNRMHRGAASKGTTTIKIGKCSIKAMT